MDPAIACVAATAVCILSVAFGTPLASTIAGAVATVLLAWSVAVDGSRWGWALTDIAQAHL